jgi:nitrate reductase gamma subunit
LSLADLIEGPFVKAALVVFAVGFALRLTLLFARRGSGPHSPARKSPAAGALLAGVSWVVPKRGFFKRNPIGAFAAAVFHVTLFSVLFFDPYHEIFLWEDVFGFSWGAFSEETIGILVLLCLGSLAVLYINRFASSTLRKLSTFGDYFALTLVG